MSNIATAAGITMSIMIPLAIVVCLTIYINDKKKRRTTKHKRGGE